MEQIYGEAFFDDVERTARASALRVVPVAVRAFRPRHVVDVGCGEGVWAAAFTALGVPALGIDDAHVEPRRRLLRRFLVHDLTAPLPPLGRFDLALCLEVAEHLPAEAADVLVTSLAEVSDRILFSAAVPGQGGTGHVNEQPHGYWVERFERAGYRAEESWRGRFADDEDVAWWYRQNLILLERRVPRPDHWPYLPDLTPPTPVTATRPADLTPFRARVGAHLRNAAAGHRLGRLGRASPVRLAGAQAEVIGALQALDEGLAALAAELGALRDSVGAEDAATLGGRLRVLEYEVRRLHGPLLSGAPVADRVPQRDG